MAQEFAMATPDIQEVNNICTEQENVMQKQWD